MKTFILAAAAATTVIASAGAASAAERSYRPSFAPYHDATPVIDRRQAAQNAQIERGRQNGSLTWFEYRALKAEQARIAEMERRAKADGRADRGERRDLWQAQDRAASHIDELTHNGRSRWYWFRRS